MSFLNKIKSLANDTVDIAKNTAIATKKAYNEGGIEAVGFKVGEATKIMVSDVSDYATEVATTAKKAGNRSALVFNKEQPNAQMAAGVALSVIAGMRKVGLDTVDKFNSLDSEPTNKNKPK
ncbi:hypothetical protein GW796_06805 [archaeon]|nr:hypothetical protein [archaeon]